MTARIENLTARLVTVMLNSGTAVHLPPGHAIEAELVEIEDNAKVRKLRDALVIAVTGPDAAAEEAEEAEEVAQPAEEPADRKPKGTHPRRQPSA